MTEVTLERVDSTYHFKGFNSRGGEIDVDSVGDRDGDPVGVGPMECLLFGLGGCSGIDIVMILTKGRQQIDSFRMRVRGERPSGQGARPYSEINTHYELTGNLDPLKVLRAVRLSHEKYCSVVKSLEHKTKITYSCTVNGEALE